MQCVCLSITCVILCLHASVVLCLCALSRLPVSPPVSPCVSPLPVAPTCVLGAHSLSVPQQTTQRIFTHCAQFGFRMFTSCSLCASLCTELREGFKEFEYKNKGIVKCESLGECMRTMGYMPTEMRLIELSSGKVDFEDFSDLMGPKVVEDTTHMIGIREMKEAFQEIDADGDGQISAAELKEAMKSLLGEQLSPAELEEILQDADLNGDGQIDFQEFVRMMSH
uniref:Calcium binding protein 2a n=1 Tax=Paramormyrops kingsleyae TaxID=1676925 RepID=A0A3B3S8Q0_9TELE